MDNGRIDIVVNGRPSNAAVGANVLDLLRERGQHERLVVVEINGVIVRRSAFESTMISPGDRIEIVHFVGGG
jgi:thiamine biosynthesis protein ThiS